MRGCCVSPRDAGIHVDIGEEIVEEVAHRHGEIIRVDDLPDLEENVRICEQQRVCLLELLELRASAACKDCICQVGDRCANVVKQFLCAVRLVEAV